MQAARRCKSDNNFGIGCLCKLQFGRPAVRNEELEALRKNLEPPKYQEAAPVENAKPPVAAVKAGPVPEDVRCSAISKHSYCSHARRTKPMRQCRSRRFQRRHRRSPNRSQRRHRSRNQSQRRQPKVREWKRNQESRVNILRATSRRARGGGGRRGGIERNVPLVFNLQLPSYVL